ncbi:MAG: hypothetical protein PHI06_11520 [Desulfobulbaceae bacterium]|nr:hypothetical protein [Desulfobulbaceae bacterium]
MPARAGENTILMEYDKMVVGEELPLLEYQYDEDMQGRYLIALEEENPWYWKESPWGDPIIHHCLLDDAPMASVMLKYKYPYGFVHGRQETEFINPMPLGKAVKIYTKVAEKYRKRDKGWLVIESLVVDQDGIEILRSRNHAMIDDERVRDAAKQGKEHIPVSSSAKYKKS